MTTSTSTPPLPARRLEEGALPKYAQLREILEEYCTTALNPGDMIPAERFLEEAFGVSRITVRRAISDLEAKGIVLRSRGRGTFVAPRPLVPAQHLASFSDEVASQHGTGLSAPTAQVLHAALEPAPEHIEKLFGTHGAEHVHITRLRLLNGLVCGVDNAWYNASFTRALLAQDLSGSIYGMLDRLLGLPITHASQTAVAVGADQHLAQMLEVDPGTPLLEVAREAYSGRYPIEWCCSVYRTDRYVLRAKVARS